ncbi:hypothetical protein Acsp02_55380 [Actinoplanes sp. NBRC 103695]|nr:hypothetical protein Acsp02_55380 [Actinoplanes sp. NBRC 103695]
MAEIGRLLPPESGDPTDARPELPLDDEAAGGADDGRSAPADGTETGRDEKEPGVEPDAAGLSEGVPGFGASDWLQRAPGPGGGGNSNPLSPSSADVRPALGALPWLSAGACCSSMGPPDRRVPTPVGASGAVHNRATSRGVPAPGVGQASNACQTSG